MSTSNFQLLRKLCLAARSLSTPEDGRVPGTIATVTTNTTPTIIDVANVAAVVVVVKAVSTVALESNPKALRVEQPDIASLEVARPFG